ncbi:MAG: hypothetical protein ACRCV3_04425 [Desulfovibrionaceae bacterium]
MRRSYVSLFALLLLFSTTLACSREKIAVLDYKKIIETSKTIQNASKYLNNLQEQYKSDTEKMTDEKLLTETLKEKQEEFTRRLEILDKHLDTKLNEILKQYVAKNNITLTLLKETVYEHSSSIDITDGILKEFDAIKMEPTDIEALFIITPEAKDNTKTAPAEEIVIEEEVTP